MAKAKKETEPKRTLQEAEDLLVHVRAEREKQAQAHLEASLDAVLQCVHALASAEVSFLDYTKRVKDSAVLAARLAQHGLMDEAFLGSYSFCMNHMQILTLQVTEARRRLMGRASALDMAFEDVKKFFEPKRLLKIVDSWSSDPVIEPHWARMVKLYNDCGVRVRLLEKIS